MCYLRKANPNDLDLLYKWVCDPLTRKNSLISKQIEYDEHKNWFYDKLNNKNSHIFIYCEDNIPVGQIRIDINDKTAQISYSIGKEHRLRGHGRSILILLEEEIRNNIPEINYLKAMVKYDNIASIKKFEQLDYIRQNEHKYVVFMKKID